MPPSNSSKLGSIFVWAAGVTALLFLALPIGALLLRALERQAWQGVAVEVLPNAIWLSFYTTFITLVLTALFGIPLAYLFARFQFPFKRVLNVLIELPIVLPPAVAGLALIVLLGRRGYLGSVLFEAFDFRFAGTHAAVVLAQTFVAAPFFVRAAQVGFQGVSREIEEAARVDGAGGWRLFWTITLPLSLRALSAGMILCWARAMGEFGATILFAGNIEGGTRTLTLLVYTLYEGDLDAAVWTGLLLIGLALVALLLSQGMAARRSDDYAPS